MKKRRKFTSGYYDPVFFKIWLETDSDPASIENSHEESTLLHEYIHFLQDVATNHGALLLSRTYNDIRAAAEVISGTPDDQLVQLPVDISNYEGLYVSRALDEALIGGSDDLDFLETNFEIRTENVQIGSFAVSQHFLDFSNGETHRIGYIDVLESMAWGIERAIYPEAAPPPELPYNTVFRLSDHLAPQTVKAGNLYAIALCELALSMSDPLSFVIQSLRDLANDEKLPENLDLFVDRVMRGVSFESINFGKFPDFASASDFFLSMALEDTQTMLRNSHLEEPRVWAKHVFMQAKRLRVADPIFITRGLLAKDPRRHYFSLIKDTIGCPIVFNDDHITFTFEQPATTTGLTYFPAIQQLHDLLLTKFSPQCILMETCRKLIVDGEAEYEVNEKCERAPWMKHADEKHCMFSKLWEGYALHRYRYSK